MTDRPPLAADDPRHGTLSGYDSHKCRCEHCKAAKRVYQARYRAKNADKAREYKARYRAKNADKVKESKARYYAENADKAREYSARYRAANVDKERERHARYHVENIDAVRERGARYRAKNADKERERYVRKATTPEGREANRTARRRRRERVRKRRCNCDTRENLAAVWRLDEGRCAYCNAPGTAYEHVVPLAKGGWGCVSNFRVACKSCNSKKGTKPLSVFLTRLAASGVTVRPGATNSGLPCPAAAERLSRRMLTA